ncbi:MAG: hypothetical protein HC819_03665 [Cyclobacteriaceae bacterium]|nr:hypothetical protein [Cyclobacteriaceae bacterium]
MMRTAKFIFIAGLMLSCIPGFGQYKIVTIASDRADGIGPCQPSIFINPKSPNMMVASFVSEKTMQTSGTKTRHNKIYYSQDFGHTWNTKNIKSRYGDFGDPCIIADNEGIFYYFHLSDPKKWDGKARW